MSLGISGLASDFDWSSFVDQMIELESAPITRITAEQTANSSQIARLSQLDTKLTALQTAANQLATQGLFSGRTAASTTINSTWSASAADAAPTGSYKINVTQLATTAKLSGAADISSPLNADDDVSGLTVANLATSMAVTAGKFTVNGQQIDVALTDSLQDVFDAISTATGGDVTASYSSATDTISLSSASTEVMLGAANDTSNFLTVMRLGNNGTGAVASSGKLGAASTTATLANARLAAPITAVDGAGEGSFAINGETITYNVNTDTLSTVIARINASSAGVTASYDGASDRMVLTNKVTGDLGVSVSETAGGLLDALGLTGTATFARGNNAEFTVNGGSLLISTSNTLSSSVHGITGLEVTVDEETSQTINVSADTDAMRTKIDAFISSYNDVQDYIDEQTKVSIASDGTITTGSLYQNREVQSWESSLRQIAFSQISGLSGTITRLENLGIDFTSGTSKLEVKDETKLTAALRDQPDDVAAFFQTGTTGLAAQLDDFITNISSYNDGLQERLNKTNTDLDRQIADIERRLEQRRAVMEAAFIRMEEAQAKITSQQATLTNAFFSDSDS